MNLLDKCRYQIFLGESEASKNCTFKYVNFCTLHLEQKQFGEYVLRSFGYLHLPNKYISLVNIYLIITYLW
jgi:hypothetical protein